jgi:twitching motility protein PilI
MTDVSSREVIMLLKDIEQRSRQQVEGVPEQSDAQGLWEGIFFNIVGTDVVAPIDEVKEILNYPSSVTQVPGAKKWLLGIANIRGNLLPVVDLQVFLGGKPIVVGKRSRVLVIDFQGNQTGLLVGGVQGLRHFNDKTRETISPLTGPIGQYVREAFKLDKETWPIFSMNRLAESTGFQAAAA